MSGYKPGDPVEYRTREDEHKRPSDRRWHGLAEYVGPGLPKHHVIAVMEVIGYEPQPQRRTYQVHRDDLRRVKTTLFDAEENR